MALIFFVGFPRALSNITGDFCSPVLLSLVRGCYSFFVTRNPTCTRTNLPFLYRVPYSNRFLYIFNHGNVYQGFQTLNSSALDSKLIENKCASFEVLKIIITIISSNPQAGKQRYLSCILNVAGLLKTRFHLFICFVFNWHFFLLLLLFQNVVSQK